MPRLAPLVGSWTVEATWPDGQPWPGLWRKGEPFAQPFEATFSEDGNTMKGRWEAAEDFTNYRIDFDLVDRRVGT